MAIQVKLLSGMFLEEYVSQFETQINQWLAAQPKGFKLHNVTMASMGERNLSVGISIWYEVLPGGHETGGVRAGGERRSDDFPGSAS